MANGVQQSSRGAGPRQCGSAMIAIWAWVVFLGIFLVVVVIAVLRTGSRGNSWPDIRCESWNPPSPPPAAGAAVMRPAPEQRMLENQPRLLSSLVMTADRVATEVMLARGYPLNDVEKPEYVPPEGISEHHARVVASYRDAHRLAAEYSRGRGGVEELRRARRNFRYLFAELLQDGSKWPRPVEDELMRRAGR
jgi:hypothetical protein